LNEGFSPLLSLFRGEKEKPYLILDTPAMGVKDKPGHYVGVVLIPKP
jgi:hypothetical protein